MRIVAAKARHRVIEFWDEHVRQWLGSGSDARSAAQVVCQIRRFRPGIVTRDGFVEPYLGTFLGLEREPQLVIMGLNPGTSTRFIARDGLFADEIRDEYGSYSAWVRSRP